MVGAVAPWISNTLSASSLPPSSSSSSSFVSNSRNSIALFPDLPPASRIFVRIKLAKHEDSKRSKGYAFIQYASQDDAISAMEQMDQKRIDGRTIYAEIAKPVNNGFADYPITSGPPSGRNQQPNCFKDHSYEEDAAYAS
ncbi:hypothetical protein ACMD2_12261 [Ananas comosus]|uniref:RRM domain-containing protein n=1 Tax=Ananas comosus TaxID=4615 RepID=A0A199UJA0_ANACO|nr:hypothetical protein ACMD2_12261 [Ananas comosus]